MGPVGDGSGVGVGEVEGVGVAGGRGVGVGATGVTREGGEVGVGKRGDVEVAVTSRGAGGVGVPKEMVGTRGLKRTVVTAT
ncbi:MAG: hypothetical protein ACE5LG_05040 [Anaerolineae bacterium]